MKKGDTDYEDKDTNISLIEKFKDSKLKMKNKSFNSLKISRTILQNFEDKYFKNWKF